MEAWFLYAGIALCLFSLWALLRHDLLRLTSISHQVDAEVVDHRSLFEDGARNFAAVFRFSAEGREHEVLDQVYSTTRRPQLGTRLQLSYPVGHPELARVPRVLMWTLVYAVLVVTTGILVARLLDWLPAGT